MNPVGEQFKDLGFRVTFRLAVDPTRQFCTSQFEFGPLLLRRKAGSIRQWASPSPSGWRSTTQLSRRRPRRAASPRCTLAAEPLRQACCGVAKVLVSQHLKYYPTAPQIAHHQMKCLYSNSAELRNRPRQVHYGLELMMWSPLLRLYSQQTLLSKRYLHGPCWWPAGGGGHGGVAAEMYRFAEPEANSKHTDGFALAVTCALK